MFVRTYPPEIQYAILAIRWLNSVIGKKNLMIPHKLTNDPWKIVFSNKNIRNRGILAVFFKKSFIIYSRISSNSNFFFIFLTGTMLTEKNFLIKLAKQIYSPNNSVRFLSISNDFGEIRRRKKPVIRKISRSWNWFT